MASQRVQDVCVLNIEGDVGRAVQQQLLIAVRSLHIEATLQSSTQPRLVSKLVAKPAAKRANKCQSERHGGGRHPQQGRLHRSSTHAAACRCQRSHLQAQCRQSCQPDTQRPASKLPAAIQPSRPPELSLSCPRSSQHMPSSVPNSPPADTILPAPPRPPCQSCKHPHGASAGQWRLQACHWPWPVLPAHSSRESWLHGSCNTLSTCSNGQWPPPPDRCCRPVSIEISNCTGSTPTPHTVTGLPDPQQCLPQDPPSPAARCIAAVVLDLYT